MRSVLLIGGAPRLRARDYIDVRDGGADSVYAVPARTSCCTTQATRSQATVKSPS